MSVYELERQIVSCLVTKDFIQQLENYLLNTIPSIIEIPSEIIREEYSLSLKDKFGTETLSSISNYDSNQFPDSTTDISVGFNIYRPKKIRIDISFNKDEIISFIRINYESDNPREIVKGIYDGIKRIIEPHSNKNKIFHPSAFIGGFLLSFSFYFFGFAVYLFLKNLYLYGMISGFVFLFILFYLSLGKWLKPYISFESKKYFFIKKWSNWFFGGFLAFIIFGTIFVLLRKKFLGF